MPCLSFHRLQISSLIILQYGVQFPDEVTITAKGIDPIVSMSVFTFISPSCRSTGSFDQFNRLITVTLAPALLILLLLLIRSLMRSEFCLSLTARCCRRMPGITRFVESGSAVWQTRLFKTALYLSYLCLPAASSQIAKVGG